MRPISILIASLLATACFHRVDHGTVKPTREVCTLGAIAQRLDTSSSPRVVRVGDARYLDDRALERALERDADAIARFTACAGEPSDATFVYRVHRIEVGSSRSVAGKLLMWTVMLWPTVGLSSIYPASEVRWVTVELDAALEVDGDVVWSTQLGRTRQLRLLSPEPLPSVASLITELMKEAQQAAVADLHALVLEVTRS